jgi:hypothetical protein
MLSSHERIPAELAAAIVAASHAISAMKADAKNDHFGNEYISLTAITERAKAAMKSHNATIMHSSQFNTPQSNGQNSVGLQPSITVETMAVHDTGAVISVEVTLPITKMDPQAGAGAITYGRRIGIAMLLGIVVDEDDDGNVAAGLASGQIRAVTSHRPATSGLAGTSMRGMTLGPSSTGPRVKMPFGRTKDQFIDELPDSEVESAIAWAESKGKFMEFQRDAKRYLASKTAKDPEPTGAMDPDDNLPF